MQNDTQVLDDGYLSKGIMKGRKLINDREFTKHRRSCNPIGCETPVIFRML